jgi:hypothetical protein
VRGENNRLGYVRRSCSVGLMDGGSIPPGSTILAAETAISDRRQPVKSPPILWTGTRLSHDFSALYRCSTRLAGAAMRAPIGVCSYLVPRKNATIAPIQNGHAIYFSHSRGQISAAK